MSRMRKKILMSLLVISLIIWSFPIVRASADWRVGEMRTKSGFTFIMLENSTLGLYEVEYKGNGKAYKVPWTVDGYVVSTIMENSFNFILEEGNYYNKTKKIPTVKEIIIPEPVTSIESSAFRCTQINKLTLPATLKDISASSLSGSSIKKITVTKGHPTLKVEDDCLINDETLLYVLAGDQKTIKIPDQVTDISGLGGHRHATKLILPSSLRTIGDDDVTSVMICYTFPALKTIVIPKEIVKLPDLFISAMQDTCQPIDYETNEPVWGLPRLERFEVEKGNSRYEEYKGMLIDVSTGTLIRCPQGLKLKDITLPESVTMIGDYAFNGCGSIVSINIPPTVKKIGEGAFAYCKNLKRIEITDSVEEFGEHIFGGSSASDLNGSVPKLDVKVTEDSKAYRYLEDEASQGYIKLGKVESIPAVYTTKETDEDQQKIDDTKVDDTWVCDSCGKTLETNFCPDCGTKRPSVEEKKNGDHISDGVHPIEGTIKADGDPDDTEKKEGHTKKGVVRERFKKSLFATSVIICNDYTMVREYKLSFDEAGQYTIEFELPQEIERLDSFSLNVQNYTSPTHKEDLKGWNIRIDEIMIDGNEINIEKNFSYWDEKQGGLSTSIYSEYASSVSLGVSWDGEEAVCASIVDPKDLINGRKIKMLFTFGTFR